MLMSREILFAGDAATGVGSRLLLTHESAASAGCACLVNPWHTNSRLPAFLCKTSAAVSGIRQAAGVGPFKQLKRSGKIALGQCVSTGAGQMRRVNNIIHAAVATPFGKTSLETVADAVGNIIMITRRLGARSLAMPLLGVDVGGLDPVDVARVVMNIFARSGSELQQLVLAIEDAEQYQRVSAAFDEQRPLAGALERFRSRQTQRAEEPDEVHALGH